MLVKTCGAANVIDGRLKWQRATEGGQGEGGAEELCIVSEKLSTLDSVGLLPTARNPDLALKSRRTFKVNQISISDKQLVRGRVWFAGNAEVGVIHEAVEMNVEVMRKYYQGEEGRWWKEGALERALGHTRSDKCRLGYEGVALGLVMSMEDILLRRMVWGTVPKAALISKRSQANQTGIVRRGWCEVWKVWRRLINHREKLFFCLHKEGAVWAAGCLPTLRAKNFDRATE